MKHLKTYKIFEAFWNNKSKKSEKYSLNSDEGKEAWNIDKFNNWFKNEYSGYGGYPGGAKGIFGRVDKLSPDMINEYFDEMNIDINFLESKDFKNLVIQNWFKQNETNTEFGDHNAGMNFYINNVVADQIPLPLDYYEFDMDEDEDELPNRTGRDDGSIPHQNKWKKADYKRSVETINVQDIMTFPTFINKEKKHKEKINDNFMKILEPFYNKVKETKNVKRLTNITEEHIENHIGFSFIYNYNKLYVLTDFNMNVFLLLDRELLKIEDSDDIMKIIENEL